MDTIEEARDRWLGTWQNTKGSVMRLRLCEIVHSTSPEKSEHFSVTGTYQTAKGRVPLEVRCPLSGYVTNDHIVFSVSFRFEDDGKGEVHSLTAWAGQVLPDPDNPSNQQLSTLWHLVPDLEKGDPEDTYGWVKAWSGADNFKRLSKDPDHSV
ncbi:avidin/streptavidin family protein [Roseibium sp. SCP14]|uniref:avidin/streptavidin family protein n=1 Tax=Roseibium sp. SCP14 TaxID=3141375 RepID=UPI00333AE55A